MSTQKKLVVGITFLVLFTVLAIDSFGNESYGLLIFAIASVIWGLAAIGTAYYLRELFRRKKQD